MTKDAPTFITAFDCFKKDKPITESFQTGLSYITKLGANPLGVTVVSPSQLAWPTNFKRSWLSEFEKLGIDLLDKFLKRNRIDKFAPVKILLQPLASRRSMIYSVLHFAEENNAIGIAVFPHSHKKGIKYPGGFVSTIIQESHLPVLVLNNEIKFETRQPVEWKRTLVATDFSSGSLQSFRRAIKLAKKLNSEIILLHVLPSVVNETVFKTAGVSGGWKSIERYFREEESRMFAMANKWVITAKQLGVHTTFKFIRNSPDISESILNFARSSQSDLIVMTQKTSRWGSLFLGSITRETLAKAKLPVLIFNRKKTIGKK